MTHLKPILYWRCLLTLFQVTSPLISRQSIEDVNPLFSCPSCPLIYECLAVDSRKLADISADICRNEDPASPFSAGLLGGEESGKCSLIMLMLVLHFVTDWSECFSSTGIILCHSKLWYATEQSCGLTLTYGILGCVRMWSWRLLSVFGLLQWRCKQQVSVRCWYLVYQPTRY